MTSTGHRTDRDHPISTAVSAIKDALTDVEHAPAWSLSDAETRHNLIALTRLAARVAALELKVAAHADRNDVGAASGATSASVWWANATRMTQAEAHRKVKLAKALRIQGRQILDVVAPEIGEAEEARQLAKEERDAEAKAG